MKMIHNLELKREKLFIKIFSCCQIKVLQVGGGEEKGEAR
jgi:hypothetical protein